MNSPGCGDQHVVAVPPRDISSPVTTESFPAEVPSVRRHGQGSLCIGVMEPTSSVRRLPACRRRRLRSAWDLPPLYAAWVDEILQSPFPGDQGDLRRLRHALPRQGIARAGSATPFDPEDEVLSISRSCPTSWSGASSATTIPFAKGRATLVEASR